MGPLLKQLSIQLWVSQSLFEAMDHWASIEICVFWPPCPHLIFFACWWLAPTLSALFLSQNNFRRTRVSVSQLVFWVCHHLFWLLWELRFYCQLYQLFVVLFPGSNDLLAHNPVRWPWGCFPQVHIHHRKISKNCFLIRSLKFLQLSQTSPSMPGILFRPIKCFFQTFEDTIRKCFSSFNSAKFSQDLFLIKFEWQLWRPTKKSSVSNLSKNLFWICYSWKIVESSIIIIIR